MMGVMEESQIGSRGSGNVSAVFVAIALVAVAAVAALGYGVYQAVLFNSIVEEIPAEIRVGFDVGRVEYFELQDGLFVPSPGAYRSDGKILHEAVPLSSGGMLAIFSAPGKSEHTVSIVSADGVLTPVYQSDRQLAELSVSGPYAVFSILAAPSESIATPDSSANEAENDVVEEGRAAGPVDVQSFVGVASDAPATRIALVAMTGSDPTVEILGDGEHARFHPDGSIIALSSEGIIRVSIISGARSVVFPYPYDDGAISADGRYVALRSTDMRFDVYDVSARPLHIGSVTSDVGIASVSFVDALRLAAWEEAFVSLYDMQSGAPQRLLRAPVLPQ